MTMMTMNAGHNSGFFARIAEMLSDWRYRADTRAQLEALSERQLNDIGLSRHEIESVVKRSA